FLATDSLLILATNIAAGLEVREGVIARHVAEQMPFMATERWMMVGVRAGGARQELHEVIRQASHAVAKDVSEGRPNDLLERLAVAPEFASVPVAQLRAELDPGRYVGRAPEQTTEFLQEFFIPLLDRAAAVAADAPAAEVTV
ncbi:MAG: adenylosuccinate lyase, partial [Gemmatimonadales bacterium]